MVMDKLKELVSRCKCGVSVEINGHKNVYQTAEEALDCFKAFGFHTEPAVRARIIEADTLVEIHFYPETPVGFYKVIHYDLDAALDKALNMLGE